MNEKRVQVPIKGKMVWGTEVSIKMPRENWSEYELEDGTILRFKAVITGVVRTEEYDDLGNPVYFLTSQNVATATNIPDDLKHKS